jgi:hypothetical protein
MLRLLRSRAEEEEERGAGAIEWSLGTRGGVLTWLRPVGRGASTTPVYGRHVAGAGWSEAGVARRREREGKPGHAVWLGRKGGGSAQQRLPPFSFI